MSKQPRLSPNVTPQELGNGDNVVIWMETVNDMETDVIEDGRS